MSHDATIPVGLHSEARQSLKDRLGSFWSYVFGDQDLVDEALAARVLSASQLYVDVMEALSLRDHRSMPLSHREHWFPVSVRLSQRNTGCGLVVGMPDRAVVGPQTSSSNPGHVYREGEVFSVGGNAMYSKVNTYPIETPSGCRLSGVRTCLCDSIASPSHVLVRGRDFDIRGDVLVIRVENDPFTAGGYRTSSDGDDTVAVMWACDAELDTGNVGDFLGYPLGIGNASGETAARLLSALWDVVVYGVTPRYLNTLLGVMFDVPVALEDSVVESVDGSCVVTGSRVYPLPAARRPSWLKVGTRLPAWSFLTDEVKVFRSMSVSDVMDRMDEGILRNLALPPGSVLGVREAVVIEDIDSELQDGGWFRLSRSDSPESPFWKAVMSRTTEDEREAMFASMVTGGTSAKPTVNPMIAIGYAALANLILVSTTRSMVEDQTSHAVLEALSRLVPDYARLLVVQFQRVDEEMPVPAESVESMSSMSAEQESVGAAGEDVSFSFMPVAATEV